MNSGSKPITYTWKIQQQISLKSNEKHLAMKGEEKLLVEMNRVF
jgi:hypothetical protein